MSVGSRIKELREDKNLSRIELANLIGVTVGAISNYENEVSSPKEPILFKIMEVLKCDANYLFQDSLNMPSMENNISIGELNIIKKYRDLSSYDQETVTQLLDRLHGRKELRNIIEYHAASDPLNRFIPYQHSASAGSGIYILGNEAADQIAIPALPEYDDVDYAVKVNGHSMEPDFCDGEAALISQRKEMEIGDVGIFVKNGEVFIKELGETELISRNPDYPNIPVTENDNVVCLGKVIGKLQA